MTNSQLIANNLIHAIGAMTHNDQPPFAWSNKVPACAPYAHRMLPDKYDFDFVVASANLKQSWEL